jgi:hypothetical protein
MKKPLSKCEIKQSPGPQIHESLQLVLSKLASVGKAPSKFEGTSQIDRLFDEIPSEEVEVNNVLSIMNYSDDDQECCHIYAAAESCIGPEYALSRKPLLI